MSETVGRFQDKVAELLIRHRSILDSLTKFQETAAKTNRAIIKSVTGCGCLTVNATKQACPPEIELKDCKKYMDTHLEGELCEHCREIVEEVVGAHLFYLSALCDLLDMDLNEVFEKEYQRLNTLGVFKMC